MSKNEKRFIGCAAVLPLIVAVGLSAVFGVTVTRLDFPFAEDTVRLAEYQKEEIKPLPQFTGESGETVGKGDVYSCLEDNMLMGDISLENSNYPIIYNANEVNALGKFNITGEKVIGEVGVCRAEIYKNDSAMLRMLSEGDVLTVNTFYSVYEYEVVSAETVSGDTQLSHCGEGIGRALVLYTDSSIGVGTGDEYYVCVCKMTSGGRVTGG